MPAHGRFIIGKKKRMEERARQSIWHEPVSVEKLNAMGEGSMVEQLGITFTEVGDDYVKGTMPVDERTHQPFGVLHGGASVVLAETLGSTAANFCVDSEKQYCVGLEVNANHLRAMRQGTVTGTARPLHLGGSTQVWEIYIRDEEGRRVCASRLTMAVLDRR